MWRGHRFAGPVLGAYGAPVLNASTGTFCRRELPPRPRSAERGLGPQGTAADGDWGGRWSTEAGRPLVVALHPTSCHATEKHKGRPRHGRGAATPDPGHRGLSRHSKGARMSTVRSISLLSEQIKNVSNHTQSRGVRSTSSRCTRAIVRGSGAYGKVTTGGSETRMLSVRPRVLSPKRRRRGRRRG
jgi:hypothetical protein